MKFTDNQKREALTRAKGRCEVCGEYVHMCYHAHHRKPRSVLAKSDCSDVGGGVGNILIACQACHYKIHHDPKWAYDNGYLLHSWEPIEAL